jgi:uncharacterized protein YbaP (TraB family)
MKIRTAALALLGLALVLAPTVAPAASGPLFCWQAEREGATLHLLGSIHAGRESWYPLDERLEEAFAAADTIACEIDLTDPALIGQASALTMSEGMYPPDEKLTDHISAETWRKLQALEGLPVPAAMLERMRPGLAATMIAQSTLARMGLDLQQGVDLTLLRRAADAGRPIVSLETPAEQVALIFGPDAVIDTLLLEEALDETPEDMQDLLDTLVEAWRAGDPEAMEAAYRAEWRDDERMQRFHEELLVKRNERMAARLAGARGHWFVVVGALHLCGEEGVPALLAERGWQVSQLGATEAVR